MMAGRAVLAGALVSVLLACSSAARATALKPQGPRLAELRSLSDCTSGTDADLDGFSDLCETELALAFAPVLLQDPSDCERADGRVAGGYAHAVQRTGPQTARIAYLPAYVTDCGWRGVKCILPGVDCDRHAGDSEMIVVEVRADGYQWRPTAVFLSAHCFDGGSDDCRWYDANALEWRGSRPIVWVSSGRHANYPDQRSCDRGHHRLDTCVSDPEHIDFPVDPARNIGSAVAPTTVGGCVPSPTNASATIIECFWNDAPFRGWHAQAPGVTSYLRYLDQIAEFVSPLDRLAWLAGCWQRTDGAVTLDEQWMAPRGGTMLGMGRVVRAGETVDFEAMRIEARADTLVFIANPSGQAEAEFRSISIADDGVVFENLSHDFPQRVIYRHVSGDSLHARIEGISGGEESGVDFRLGRAGCAT